MKNPAKISVIIPVYNVGEYLPFAMQSCIDQTLRDVEFICVNDGSTDNSLEILRKYEQLDERIIVIDKENGGVSSARNAGLKHASGKWIMFLDPDDYLSEEACERVWIESEEGATDIIIFGTDIVPKQPKAPEWYYYALTVPTKRYYEFSPYILFKEPSAKPFIWHQAYSRELIEKSGVMFEESLKLGEDQAFLICIYPHAQRFAFIEDKLYNYRFARNNSAMQILRKDPSKKMKQHLNVVEKIFVHWNENGFSNKYGSDLLSWALDFIMIDLERDEITIEAKTVFARKLFELIEFHGLTTYLENMDTIGLSAYDMLKKAMKG
ncbi:MAG: glycosyltransferase family 2 protein [Clostridia bacterium]|nr:glycosyltransferase family 2 protein [Clostridia bacterium]